MTRRGRVRAAPRAARRRATPVTRTRKNLAGGEVFSTKFALRASEMCLRHVKYADACEFFAARKWANFISLCGIAAKFHVCSKANTSHPAKAGYFTYLSRSARRPQAGDPCHPHHRLFRLSEFDLRQEKTIIKTEVKKMNLNISNIGVWG